MAPRIDWCLHAIEKQNKDRDTHCFRIWNRAKKRYETEELTANEVDAWLLKNDVFLSIEQSHMLFGMARNRGSSWSGDQRTGGLQKWEPQTA